MLSPFDDFPIHPSADPIAHPASGDPNHYDRYWFNGHDADASFFFAAGMGHYPVRGVVDAAFSVVLDGVEHSIFASGAMPIERTTAVGPIRIEVSDPLRVIHYIVEPNEHGISCDLTFRATTVAVEEPRQRRVHAGVILTDHTRLTQWGSWEGSITVDAYRHSSERVWHARPVMGCPPRRRPGPDATSLGRTRRLLAVGTPAFR